DQYLSSLGGKAKYSSLAAIVKSGLYSPYIERRLKENAQTAQPEDPCRDVYHDPRSIAMRNALLKAMEAEKIDAVIYPTWSNPPRKVGDLQSPGGDNSQMLSPQTGFPAITVPMGFINGSLPAGLTFLGKLFGEPDLIRFVYAYEQATRHRRPPEKFPALSNQASEIHFRK
ncbi:MAG: amidase, partial [Blastocatellia bacterium]|nr:amidase [Blastocatellia bacterium]